MKNTVDIEIVLDDKYIDPKVTIRTKENTQQIENIVNAIEKVSDDSFPQIAAAIDGKLTFVSQRDIIRAYVDGRKVLIETEDNRYQIKRTLSALEEDLNPDRFLRISYSEIVNLYKVKCFDFNFSGTIGVELENGVKTWVSRSKIKQIKEMLKKKSKTGGV